MEVLGMRATTVVTRGEVNRRYRRLLRDAHPDHGGAGDAAAERIAELAEARSLLLASVDVVGAQAASSEHS
jgi:curved DNA-binding protein CbpA